MEEEPEKQKSKTWLYHNKQAITQILQETNSTTKPKIDQCQAVIQRINQLLLHFLLKECEGYTIETERRDFNLFIYTKTISKNDTIVFDSLKAMEEKGNVSSVGAYIDKAGKVQYDNNWSGDAVIDGIRSEFARNVFAMGNTNGVDSDKDNIKSLTPYIKIIK